MAVANASLTEHGVDLTAARTPRVELLRMMFDAITLDELVDWVEGRDPMASFEYVVTPNVDHVVRLDREYERLAPAYRDAAIAVCDSQILSGLARLSGIRLPPIPGSDLTSRFFGSVLKPGDPIVILGGEPSEIDRLKARFKLKRVAHHNPPKGILTDSDAMDEVVRFVMSHPARYIFLALGSPQQELIAHRIQRTGKVRGLGFCIGASIDFLTGKIRRAPQFMRVMGIEWLHRMIQEPRRLWRRYLVDDMAVWGMYWRWSRNRRSK